MKRTIIKILSLGLLISVFSCTDLEEEPVGLLAPEAFFKTPADVEAAIFGAYGRIASESIYGRKLTLTLQLLSDMVDIGDRGTPARRQEINDFRTDSRNGMISAFWPQLYTTISTTNAAIDGVTKINGSEQVKQQLEAEARFVRAFCYYHLVRLFSDIPYIDYFVNDPDAIRDISSTPEAEVYQNIIADLEFGKQHLADQYTSDVRTRPTKGTAASYLASVYLTRGDFQKAAQEAEWVINNASTFNYSLESDFQDLYRSDKADELTEHIFAIDFLGQQSGEGGANDDLMGPITGIRGSDFNGWSVNVPALDVYTGWDPRDYRRKVSFEDTTLVGGVPTPFTDYQVVQRPHIAKFFRFPGNSNSETRYSDHNYVAMRYAEVLLIAAEALNEVNNGPTAKALEYINMVRERARNWPVGSSDFPADLSSGLNQTDFRETVMEERRLELAFEFKRWYDIKRHRLGEQVFKGPNARELHENFDPNKHYLLPLPQDELDINPNLRPDGTNNGY
ncbi:MAG: RagB/SusD family nutrient uptake outer membrane protein [Candidatus Cyclobacteriaceae bacterium M3_2C_046]